MSQEEKPELPDLLHVERAGGGGGGGGGPPLATRWREASSTLDDRKWEQDGFYYELPILRGEDPNAAT
ncbi:hypothetical protein MY4824_008366, partial [Beauveria thailandica]